MLAALAPDTMRDALRQVFPYPCRSRYVAVSMVPRPPPLLSRLLSGLTSTLGSVGAALGLPVRRGGAPTLPYPPGALGVEGVDGGSPLDGALEVAYSGELLSPGGASAALSGGVGAGAWRAGSATARMPSAGVGGGVGGVGSVGALQRTCSTCSDGGHGHGHRHGDRHGEGWAGVAQLIPSGVLLMLGAAAATAAVVGVRVWFGRSRG